MLTKFMERFTTETSDDSKIKTQDTASKRSNINMTIGAELENATVDSEEHNSYLDTSDPLCIVQGVTKGHDAGNAIRTVITRLKEGQMLIVDFSNLSTSDKVETFNILWGCVTTLDGSYKILKKDELVLFFSDKNSYSEQNFK